MLKQVFGRFFRHAHVLAGPEESGRRARRVGKPSRLAIESLEERLLLAGGYGTELPPGIVVGRTPSAHTTAEVQNGQLDITFTVYNQQADPVSNVRLADELAPGVAFQNASLPPDQSGQELSWNLGTIDGFGRASVTLTVSLPGTVPTQFDTGARASGTQNGGTESDDAPAVILRTGNVDLDLLAATPDANTADPFIQEQAAALDYDPQRIFDFLNNEIGYESYVGSLRGARGTLWSEAGNSLDEASLGVALYRASGIPARYARGRLSDATAQALILTMFPEPTQLVGYLAPGTEVADPANDPTLLAETRDHYWIQIDTGSGFRDADTSGLAGGGLGTAFTTIGETFTIVPDALRHRVRVTLDAETYSLAAAAFGGNGLTNATVLDQTFSAVDLVGKPLSVGQFVSDNTLGGFAFLSRDLTYTPYFLIGDAADPSGQTDELTVISSDA